MRSSVAGECLFADLHLVGIRPAQRIEEGVKEHAFSALAHIHPNGPPHLSKGHRRLFKRLVEAENAVLFLER